MTLDYIIKKFGIFTDYIEIPNVGRDDLASLFKELEFERGVEVGVASGEYSEIIMQASPEMYLQGVDPYQKYEGYHDYKLRSTFDKMETEAHDRLDKYENYMFVKKFSVDAAEEVMDGYLDFVYLDGNHSGEAVKEDIETWVPKIREGGIISGHDFTGRWPSLKKAVVKYCQENDKQLFILGMENNDLGIYRDTSRSWFFIV